jgi:hypothetical protein
MPINDELWALDRKLAKYPEDQLGSALERRLILRDFAEKIRRDAYDQGHADGMRDERDARMADEEIRRKAVADETEPET